MTKLQRSISGIEGTEHERMKFAVLDFETTGNQPADEIIQVGLVIIEDEIITNRYSSFVKPVREEIPEFIKDLTGITEDVLKEAPPLEDVIGEVLPFLRDAVIVAHNAAFDLGFLQRALDQCGYSPFDGRVLDTLDMLRIVFPGLATLKLEMVSSAFDVEHHHPHQADSDAEATALIWLECLSRLDQLPLLTIQRLSILFETCPPPLMDLAWFLHDYRMQRELRTSEDTNSHRYYRQFALNVDDWSDEEPVRLSEPSWDDLDPSFELFYESLKERLKSEYENYESREAQEQMIEHILSAFETQKHLMVEAGTGTGKSLAYLIPALYYGIMHDEKVVVSTHTINLQEQLRTRDVPLLQRIFPVPFQAATLKGRSHYMCLRKFEHIIQMKDFEITRDDLLSAAQLVVWLSETETGEDEELHFGNKGDDFWHAVASDADSCLNRACPWFRKCFYHRAKHRANIADVVITNHSMLFTDVKAEHRLIPAYRYLVVDEAHHLEDVASRHLGVNVSYFALTNVLQLLYRDAQSGQLPFISKWLSLSGIEALMDKAEEVTKLYPEIIKIKEQWDELTEWLYQNFLAERGKSQGESTQIIYRVKPQALPKDWEAAIRMEDNIHVSLAQVIRQLEKVLLDLKETDEAEALQGHLVDLNGLVKELAQLRDAVRGFIQMKQEDYVYWLEASTYYKSKSFQLSYVPVDVSTVLKETFFSKKESVVLTSATLSVNRSFDYSAEQLGLKENKENGTLETVQLTSPFDYRNNVLLCIPRDFPKVKGGDFDDRYVEQLTQSLADAAEVTNGRMLVLFTSYRMLREAYTRLKEKLAPQGIQVFGQGIDTGNRSKLTRMFQEDRASVLLGTSSFWEGVDIPGEALSCLAIVRLPFQPPNHPIVEAKSEFLRKQNKNPFMDYSVPQAVIRFKQGFGRLIRSDNDFGFVLVYDTRVIDTSYGKHFLYSLPGPKIEHMKAEQMVPRMKEWLKARESE